MKKIILPILSVFACSAFSAEPFSVPTGFDASSLCKTVQEGMGGSYQYVNSKISPEQYCEAVVARQTDSTNLSCSSEELIQGCIDTIKKTQKNR